MEQKRSDTSFKQRLNLSRQTARNSQLLRQINVGTVNMLFDRPISLLVAGTCIQLEQMCVQYNQTRKYLVHGNRAGTSINILFRTVHTCPVAQLEHRDVNVTFETTLLIGINQLNDQEVPSHLRVKTSRFTAGLIS